MSSIHSTGGGGFGGGGAKPGGGDPNGMEKLASETDEQYIARQTRLRNEAKARMAAKFGGGGMGGVGSGGGMGSIGGSRMGGVGSDPHYNPHSGYGASDFDVSALSSTVISGLGSAFGALSTVASSVTAVVQDENTKRQVVETAGSFWGGLSMGASKLMSTVTQPDDPGSDGLADLQRQFHSQRSTNPNSKYGGFGSESMMGGRPTGSMAPSFPAPTMATTTEFPTSTLGEAMPGPGEDPNGIERLSGESDEQYVMRQTRLRDEAKARMAAKFGGGGRMGGVGSNSMGGGAVSAPSSGGFGGIKPVATMAAPSSGNFYSSLAQMAPKPAAPSSEHSAKLKVTSGDDFFANFGS